METSPEIKQIATALLAFQKDAPSVTKDAKANYGKYATLGNVIDSTRNALATNGLSFMQFPDGDGLTTLIMHTSGEWIRATGKLILDKQTAQGLGSALTYSRRYGLTAALGIAADDDDDGNEASKTPRYDAVRTSQSLKTAPPLDAKPSQVEKDKATIKGHLLALKYTPKTVADAAASIMYETGLEFVEENYQAIVERLEALVDEHSQK